MNAMAEVSLTLCRTLAMEHQLSPQFIEKEFRVFDLLGTITRATAPTKDFVFKGGTALNKVYLKGVQRFSEDLDFDVATTSLTGVKKYYDRHLAAKLEGFELSTRTLPNMLLIQCGYENVFGQKDFVRLDLTPKPIATAHPLAVKPAESDLTGRFVTGFSTYSLEDLVARKLHALATRKTVEGKDVYDVSRALPQCGSLTLAIARMLESERSKQTPDNFLDRAIDVLSSAEPKRFKRVTYNFIPRSLRPKDWSQLTNQLAHELTVRRSQASAQQYGRKPY